MGGNLEYGKVTTQKRVQKVNPYLIMQDLNFFQQNTCCQFIERKTFQ